MFLPREIWLMVYEWKMRTMVSKRLTRTKAFLEKTIRKPTMYTNHETEFTYVFHLSDMLTMTVTEEIENTRDDYWIQIEYSLRRYCTEHLVRYQVQVSNRHPILEDVVFVGSKHYGTPSRSLHFTWHWTQSGKCRGPWVIDHKDRNVAWSICDW